MKLKKLHSDVIKKTRSSFMINTLSQAVLELILNSLDAEATAIAVRINMVTLRIQVVDNGKGVLKENMQSIGNRYFTNKCSSLEDLERRIIHYGFRGEALANLIELSKSVNICSRHTGTSETFSLTYEKKKKKEPVAEKTRPSAGTTVTVEGLFDAFPVRKKRIVKEIELDDVQRNLRSLIIIHPHVTFSLRDDVRNELVLSSRKNQDIPSAFRLLHPDMKDGAVMKISKGKLTINSLLFKDYTENKHQQYIYVNKRPVFSSKIQKLMKKLLNKNTKYQETKLVNSKKYPSYVINIKCPYSDVDILSSPHTVLAQFKNWNRIETCIEKLINCFFGNPQNKKQNPISDKVLSDNVPKKSGISQINGAVQAFGYRRKNEPEHISPAKQETKKKPSILKNSYNENHLNNDTHDIINPTCVYQQTKAVKHPLPITVAPKNTNESEAGNEIHANKRNIIYRKRSHPPEEETFSKNSDDEHKGKNLILDMFLKSTQVYKSEENVMNTSQQSGDTIYVEESDFLMENNVQTTHKGKTKTMSVSINVKSRKKIKKRKNCTSEKGLQTVSADKMVSKCIQTTMQNDESTMHCSDKENFSVNCTLVFTSRKGNNWKFVHKRPQNSGNFELFGKENSQKCNCNCHEKKLFNFGNKDLKNQNEVGLDKAIETNIKDSFQLKSFGDILDQTIRSDRNTNTSRYFDPGSHWKIDKKRKMPDILKCEQSPYFKDKRHHPANKPLNDYFNIYCNKENYDHYPITENANINFLNQYNPLFKNIQNHNIPNRIHQFPQTYEGKRMELIPYSHPYNQNTAFNYPPINPVTEDYFLPYNRFQHVGLTYNEAPVSFPQNFNECHRNQAGFSIGNNAQGATNTQHCTKMLDNYNFQSNNLDIPLRNEENAINSNAAIPIPSFKQFQPAFKSTQKNPFANSIIDLSLANQINSNTESFENFQPVSKSTWTNPSFLDFSLKNQQNNDSSYIQSFGQFKPIFKSTQEKNPTKHFTNDIPDESERGNPISGLFAFQKEREKSSEDQQNRLRKASDLEISLSETDKGILVEAEIAAEKQLLMKEFAEWNSQFTLDEQKSNDDWDWTKRDHLGNCYYVNKKTGFTTYNVPKENTCFEMKERYEFLPKGMSPIIKETKAVEKSLSQNGKDVLLDYILETYRDDLLFVKWQHYIKDLDIKTFFANMYTEKLKMYECCIPSLKADNQQEVINLNKNLFVSLDFIGQLDKKFIVVRDVKENMLILFDQHAVHERIRLEKLLKIYKNAKAAVKDKLMFFVPENELSLLRRFSTYLDHVGINVEFFTNGIYVTEVPLCLYTKFKEDPINSLNKIIHTLVNEVLDLLKSTRGVSLKTMPTLIQNVINLEACRGAIKFGDFLTHEKCLELLRELSKCDLPFQCAHGRPTVTPLLRLTTQKPVEKPINLKNLKCLKNMHS